MDQLLIHMVAGVEELGGVNTHFKLIVVTLFSLIFYTENLRNTSIYLSNVLIMQQNDSSVLSLF